MSATMPDTWRTAKLGDVTLAVERINPASKFSDSFSYIDISAVDNVSKRIVGNLEQKVSGAPSRARQLVYSGDVLVSTVRPGLNAVAAVPDDLPNAVASTGFCVLRPNPQLLLSDYLFHFVITGQFVQSLVSRQKGGAYPAVSDDDIRSLAISLPPLSEQHRIVKILQEAEEIRRRRAQAEAATAELIPAIFEESFGDPIGNPKRWPIHELADLIEGTPKNGLYKPAALYGEGTPIIRIGDFGNENRLDVRNLQRVRLSEDEIAQFDASNDHILINRVNSIKYLGKSVRVCGVTEPTVYESNMMRLTLRRARVEPDFLIACLQHTSVLTKLRGKAKKAINQASINQTDVLTLKLAVPPIKLQQTFAKQVADIHAMGVADAESHRVGEILSASLSAHAFSGRLTANWRETHKQMLATESRARDRALEKSGSALTRGRRVTIDEFDDIFSLGADGIYAELNREQRDLLFRIQQAVGGVDYGRYFTAEKLAANLDGALHRNPQAIEAHLTVFAVRGLVLPVSRPRNETAGRPFAACYRLPLPGPNLGVGFDISDPATPSSDDIRLAALKRIRSIHSGGATLG